MARQRSELESGSLRSPIDRDHAVSDEKDGGVLNALHDIEDLISALREDEG